MNTPGSPVGSAGRVLRQFRVVFGAVRSQFSRVADPSGVGGTQLWALSLVQQRPGIGVGALAQALNVRQPSASRLVHGLHVRGLLEVQRSDADRRAVHLHPTPAGLALLSRSRDPLAGELATALARLDAGTLARLERHLGQVIDRLQPPPPDEPSEPPRRTLR